MLNQDSPIPLYYQLYQIIRKKIDSEEFGEGDKIPSENELAKLYGIGRPTVRQACERLIDCGLLEKKKGSGTYVREGKKEVNVFSMAGTSAAFLEKGIILDQHLVDNLSLSETGLDPNNPFSGSIAYFFSRISTHEGEPVLLELIYLDRNVFAGLENYELAGHSLARIVEEYFFMKPCGGKQRFAVSALPTRYAHLFSGDGGSSFLLVRRTLHFKQKESAIYTELFYRTDRFEFSQDLGGFFYG